MDGFASTYVHIQCGESRLTTFPIRPSIPSLGVEMGRGRWRPVGQFGQYRYSDLAAFTSSEIKESQSDVANRKQRLSPTPAPRVFGERPGLTSVQPSRRMISVHIEENPEKQKEKQKAKRFPRDGWNSLTAVRIADRQRPNARSRDRDVRTPASSLDIYPLCLQDMQAATADERPRNTVTSYRRRYMAHVFSHPPLHLGLCV
jgi:hypothetical protein